MKFKTNWVIFIGIVHCFYSFNLFYSQGKFFFEEFNKIVSFDTLSNFRSISNSPLRILHIGDSHIEMGCFSTGFLNELKNHNVEILNSLIFPTKNKNKEGDYFVHVFSKYEIKTCVDSKKDKTIFGKNVKVKVRKAKIKFSSSKNEISQILIFHNANCLLKKENNMEISQVKFNDTLLKSLITYKKPNKKQKTIFISKEKDHSFYGFLLNPMGNFYINSGISGAQFSDFNSYSMFEKVIEELEINLVIFTLGTNDSYRMISENKFLQTLDDLKMKLKNLPCEVLIMSVPFTSYKTKNPPYLDFINKELFLFCKSNYYLFWDWHKLLGSKENLLNLLENKILSEDMLHFTPNSYKIMGSYFGKAVISNLIKEYE